MDPNQDASKAQNPWPRFAWWFTVAALVVLSVLGFGVLSRYQQNEQELPWWAAICRAVGLTSDNGPAGAPQPPLQTPTRIAWTKATLAQIESGSVQHGATAAAGCAGCHGQNGVSAVPQFPTLAGMDAAVIYKELDDFRAGKRDGGVMNAIATPLSAQDSADVAAFFASRTGGLWPVAGEPIPEGGRSLRQSNATIRLVYAGDPHRGIAPCAACHGPGDHKFGAPALQGQHPEYIEGQLQAFGQGKRKNDIDEQMRIIAAQLTPEEMHAIALHYAGERVKQTQASNP